MKDFRADPCTERELGLEGKQRPKQAVRTEACRKGLLHREELARRQLWLCRVCYRCPHHPAAHMLHQNGSFLAVGLKP